MHLPKHLSARHLNERHRDEKPLDEKHLDEKHRDEKHLDEKHLDSKPANPVKTDPLLSSWPGKRPCQRVVGVERRDLAPADLKLSVGYHPEAGLVGLPSVVEERSIATRQ